MQASGVHELCMLIDSGLLKDFIYSDRKLLGWKVNPAFFLSRLS